MRKAILSMFISLDGYITGPKGEFVPPQWSDDLEGAVARLKAEGDGDLYMFGGAGIAQSFVARDLFDEYRLMVTPTLFGDGQRLFAPGFDRIDLTLIENRTLDTGAVILHYRRERG